MGQQMPFSAGDMRTGPLASPGERMRLAAIQERHQFVVGGMKFHHVDAVAEAVVRAQFGQVPVGLARQVLDVLAPDQGADLVEVVGGPVGAEFANRLDQRPVTRIAVVVFKRAGLIEHLVRGKNGGRGIGGGLHARRGHHLAPGHEISDRGNVPRTMGPIANSGGG
jgi:hypothetical protein